MCMSACMYMHMGKCPRRPEVSNAIGSPLTEMLGTDIRTQTRAVCVLHGWALSPAQSFDSSFYSFATPDQLTEPLGSRSPSVRWKLFLVASLWWSNSIACEDALRSPGAMSLLTRTHPPLSHFRQYYFPTFPPQFDLAPHTVRPWSHRRWPPFALDFAFHIRCHLAPRVVFARIVFMYLRLGTICTLSFNKGMQRHLPYPRDMR